MGWCRGCGRTEDEIAEWNLAEDTRREAIWALLPKRVEALGIAITRLPWRHGRIAEFVAESLEAKSGTWAVGCHGARIEFMCLPDEPCRISVSDDRITAVSARGGLQLTIGETVRALQLRADHRHDGFCAIFLVVSKTKLKEDLPFATGLTPLGRDEGALRPEGRDEHWYDLGLGRADLRFGIRTAERELQEKLTHASGMPLPGLLEFAAPAIQSPRLTRVAESTIGRAEIFPSVSSMAQAPEGPRALLVPEEIANGRTTPPGIDLPPVYALGATFSPRGELPVSMKPV